MAALPFCLQPGLCHPAVLRALPTEEVSGNLRDVFLTQGRAHWSSFLNHSRECCVTSVRREFLTPFTSAAPYQSAAWNQNCRRKSGPATQGWSESTSTKGFERRGPSPHANTLPPHGHRRGPHCQPSSLIQCAKVTFVSPPHLQPSGQAPASRWRSS